MGRRRLPDSLFLADEMPGGTWPLATFTGPSKKQIPLSSGRILEGSDTENAMRKVSFRFALVC
jgi:hypothetical protein